MVGNLKKQHKMFKMSELCNKIIENLNFFVLNPLFFFFPVNLPTVAPTNFKGNDDSKRKIAAI